MWVSETGGATGVGGSLGLWGVSLGRNLAQPRPPRHCPLQQGPCAPGPLLQSARAMLGFPGKPGPESLVFLWMAQGFHLKTGP